MELTIDDGENKMKIEFVKLQKMILLFNALEDGWTIKKKNENYVFIKKHNNEREIYLESYLKDFMRNNMDIQKLLN
jgi:hypothetical protein|tara:strand:+ start:108 stop:335 length:228 start_codon:yes stop_codon:yes gene_type:complete